MWNQRKWWKVNWRKQSEPREEPKDGMGEEPVEEGVFDSPLISNLLLVCVIGILGLYPFGSTRKELDPVRLDLTVGQTQTWTDFNWSIFSNRKTNLLSNHKFPTLSLSPHFLLKFPFTLYVYTLSKVEIEKTPTYSTRNYRSLSLAEDYCVSLSDP